MKKVTNENMPEMISKMFIKINKIEKFIKRSAERAEEKASDLLTIEMASKFLNLSVSTIYSKVSRNEIPVNKQGKRLYFYRAELSEWIRSGRIKTTEEIRKEVDLKFNNGIYLK